MKQEAESKLGTVPVNKLLLGMGIPMILSMMLQAVYNIVDSAFVSNMPQNGEAALNALTLAFPIQMLMVAVAIGTGVGANALLSKSLGQGDPEKASRVAGNALFLGVVIYVACLAFGLFGARAYIATQTTNPLILEMGTSYLSICCCVSMGIIFFAMFEKLLQATGRSVYSTIAQIVGAAVNIVLDPIMIYGLFDMPALGVQGAAYATIIGQIASALTGLIFHLRFNVELKKSIRYMKPDTALIKGIYAIGLPAIIAQALMSVMTYGMNIILGRIDESVVTAYGLYYKIQQFLLFAAFGLRDAITPVVSYNHGKQDKERINAGIKYGMRYTLIIMAVGMIVIELFAKPFSAVFGLSGQTQLLTISAMHFITLSFLFAGANVAFQGIFQALDAGMESLIISVCRQFLFVLPVAFVFSMIVGNDLQRIWIVWLTFLIAEGLSVMIAMRFMRKIRLQKVEGMKDFHAELAHGNMVTRTS
ncbi:MAG: MATE family efflux transporter [Lachnospiraceae bacterium]|nr:MATE family efflux transporter [Lachnospiraceae bacterium]